MAGCRGRGCLGRLLAFKSISQDVRIGRPKAVLDVRMVDECMAGLDQPAGLRLIVVFKR